ncbi:DUF4302 domain-containing protein [Niabella sp.]|uniref:DUF4302 domain-containing protein n=1 Tax=Niabella sp. TaxID=1962976 RepID=UPI0026251160|nr:DUF4302 domain-containing protein [Niabella sp.]
MNKIVVILLVALIANGCRKNDVALVNGGLPEERMAERLAELRSQLTGAQNGWLASLTTTAGGGYGFYMKFGADEKVIMMGDLNNNTATQSQVSTYRVKWVMNASLIFDTYNYVTLLQDPVPGAYGGKASSGYKSDIEFEYIRSSGDSLILQGKKYRNYLFLVKATAAQATAYQQGKLADKIKDVQNYFGTHFNNYVTIGGIVNKVSFVVSDDKRVSVQYADPKDSVITVNSKFNFNLDGIGFADDFIVNGVKFKNGVMSDGVLKLYDDKGTEYTVAQNATPVIPLRILFAYNKTYNSIMIPGKALPAGITSNFNSVYAGLISRYSGSSGGPRTIDSVEFRLSSGATALVRIWYWNSTNTSHLLADASFDYTYDNGIVTLSNYTPSVSNTNWTVGVTNGWIGAFLTWFQSGPFKIDWVAASGGQNLGGLYMVSDPASFYYGELKKR